MFVEEDYYGYRIKKGTENKPYKKENSNLGEILVNLNWNQKVQKGFLAL